MSNPITDNRVEAVLEGTVTGDFSVLTPTAIAGNTSFVVTGAFKALYTGAWCLAMNFTFPSSPGVYGVRVLINGSDVAWSTWQEQASSSFSVPLMLTKGDLVAVQACSQSLRAIDFSGEAAFYRDLDYDSIQRGGLVVEHNELSGRSDTDSHPASAISYGSADNVEAKLDQVTTSIDALEVAASDLSTEKLDAEVKWDSDTVISRFWHESDGGGYEYVTPGKRSALALNNGPVMAEVYSVDTSDNSGTRLIQTLTGNYSTEGATTASYTADDKIAVQRDVATETNRASGVEAILASRIAALTGEFTVIGSENFGKTLNLEDTGDYTALSDFFITCTPGASVITDVHNGSVVINLYDDESYVYNAPDDLILDLGSNYVSIATASTLGVVKGSPSTTANTVVIAPDGAMTTPDLFKVATAAEWAAAEDPPGSGLRPSFASYVVTVDSDTWRVTSDGASYRVGSGTVKSVDGVQPVDFNVPLTVAMTQAQFNAEEDPVGSGLFPSLKGRTVTLTDVYPEGRLFATPDWQKQSQNLVTLQSSYLSTVAVMPESGYVWTSAATTLATPDYMAVLIDGAPRVICESVVISAGNFFNTSLTPIRKGQSVQLNTYTAGLTSPDVRFVPVRYVASPAPQVIMSPGADYSLTEQPVLVWDPSTRTTRQKLGLDGRPVFSRSFTGTIPTLASGYNTITLPLTAGARELLHSEGNVHYVLEGNEYSGNAFGNIQSTGVDLVSGRMGIIQSSGQMIYMIIVSNSLATSLATFNSRLAGQPYSITVQYTREAN